MFNLHPSEVSELLLKTCSAKPFTNSQCDLVPWTHGEIRMSQEINVNC